MKTPIQKLKNKAWKESQTEADKTGYGCLVVEEVDELLEKYIDKAYEAGQLAWDEKEKTFITSETYKAGYKAGTLAERARFDKELAKSYQAGHEAGRKWHSLPHTQTDTSTAPKQDI